MFAKFRKIFVISNNLKTKLNDVCKFKDENTDSLIVKLRLKHPFDPLSLF